MALPMIETGYKPEFGLGAVYQGFNAANADMSAEEELVKQFLANQRERQMQPLDIRKANLTNEGMVFDNMKKSLEGHQSQAMNTPELLQAFVADKQAGFNKNIRQDELDGLLHRFRKDAVPSQGQTLVADAGADAQLAGERQRILAMPDGPERRAAAEQYSRNVATRGYTPEFWGKNEVENTKGYWDLEKTGIMASAQRDAAHAGGKAAWAQALPVVRQELSSLEDKLTKLNNNALGDLIEQAVVTRGIPKGTQAYEDAKKTVKTEWRTQLEKELKAARENYNTVLQASGLFNSGTPVPASTSNSSSSSGRVIKLD